MRVLLVILIFTGFIARANDPDSSKLLIADMSVQIEATEAMNAMYNFDFDEARKGRFRTVLSNEDSGIQLGFIDIVLRDVGLWHFNAIDQ